jgi:hypothetical protein
MPRPYSATRHLAAIAAWRKHAPRADDAPTYIARDFDALPPLRAPRAPLRIAIRLCHGCGVEHILRGEHLVLYPEPADPRPLCPACEPDFDKQRDAELNGTGQGAPHRDIRALAVLAQRLRDAAQAIPPGGHAASSN